MAPKDKRKGTEKSPSDSKRAKYTDQGTSLAPQTTTTGSAPGGPSSLTTASRPDESQNSPTVGQQGLTTLLQEADVYRSEKTPPDTTHESSMPAGSSSAAHPVLPTGRAASESSGGFEAEMEAEYNTGKYWAPEASASRGADQDSGDLEAEMEAEFNTGKYWATEASASRRVDQDSGDLEAGTTASYKAGQFDETQPGDGATNEQGESITMREPGYSEAAIEQWRVEAGKSSKGKAPMPRVAGEDEPASVQDQSLPMKESARQLPNNHLILENNPEGFISRTEFESDDHPEKIAEFGYRRVQEGDTKLNAEGVPHKSNRSRLKQKTTGEYILPSTITTRPSATEKYMNWQKSGHEKRSEQKAKREIILIEHEPDGQAGEPDRWAAKLTSSQWDSLAGQPLRIGSQITIHVDVTDIRLNALGLAKKWHEALLTLGRMRPQITIIIDDDSILSANAASYYPPDTIDADCDAMNHHNFNDRAMIVTQTPDLDPDSPGDFRKGVERIRATRRSHLTRQCADIDENIGAAQEFVHQMRRLRNYKTKSPSVEFVSRSGVEEYQGGSFGDLAGLDASGTLEDPVELE